MKGRGWLLLVMVWLALATMYVCGYQEGRRQARGISIVPYFAPPAVPDIPSTAVLDHPAASPDVPQCGRASRTYPEPNR
jgi:hypothetical protein